MDNLTKSGTMLNLLFTKKKIIMKTKLLSIVSWITLTCYAINSNAQANQNLSNLISPTAVNVNLLPGGTTGTKNLGSDTKRWKNGYFNGAVRCYGAGSTFGVNGAGSTFGVYGNAVTYGVYGHGSYGVRGDGSSVGVWGTSTSNGWAGYFSGKVYAFSGYYTSDQKLKQNIRDFTSALDIINKLKPKQYEFRQDGNYKLMNLPQGSHFGLIAQDVEKVLPDLVNDTKFETAMAQPQAAETALPQIQESGKTETQSEIIEFKALNYTELIPVLIKGMQELNDELKFEVRNLLAGQASLKSEIDKLKSVISSGNSLSTSLSNASIAQNVPNPFPNTTIIKYTVPSKFTSAQIVITDKNGKQLKQLNISDKGNGTLHVDASTLSSGTYNYSLVVDGKIVSTKQMVVLK